RWRLIQKRRYKRLVALSFDFKLKRLSIVNRRRRGFGMPTAHHGGVESLFDDLAGAGLDYGFTAQHRRAMSLLVEVRLNPVGFVGGEQTGIGMRVAKFQPSAALQHLVGCHAPFSGESLNPLASHLVDSIQRLILYPVAP